MGIFFSPSPTPHPTHIDIYSPVLLLVLHTLCRHRIYSGSSSRDSRRRTRNKK